MTAHRASMDDLLAVFKAEQARAVRPSGTVTPRQDKAPALSRAEMIEEAEAIEAAWLATRAVVPLTADGVPAFDRDAMISEAIAIEAAWLETRISARPPVEPTPAAIEEAPAAEAVAFTDATEQASPIQDGGPPQPPRGGRGRWLRYAWGAISWTGMLAAAAAVIAIAAFVIVPRAMGWQGMVVLSGSMEPELRVGGLAFMEPVGRSDLDSIQPGDVITYRVDGLRNYISHRVVEVVADGDGVAFVTKGDANDSPDVTPVAAERVVGVVRFDLPYVGHLVNRLQDRSTYYVFVGIPAALLIVSELWSVATQINAYYRGKAGQAGATS